MHKAQQSSPYQWWCRNGLISHLLLFLRSKQKARQTFPPPRIPEDRIWSFECNCGRRHSTATSPWHQCYDIINAKRWKLQESKSNKVIGGQWGLFLGEEVLDTMLKLRGISGAFSVLSTDIEPILLPPLFCFLGDREDLPAGKRTNKVSRWLFVLGRFLRSNIYLSRPLYLGFDKQFFHYIEFVSCRRLPCSGSWYSPFQMLRAAKRTVNNGVEGFLVIESKVLEMNGMVKVQFKIMQLSYRFSDEQLTTVALDWLTSPFHRPRSAHLYPE